MLDERMANGEWRVHPNDLAEEVPGWGLGTVYHGSTGMLWGLAELVRRGHVDADTSTFADHLHQRCAAYPTERDFEAPSWMLGTSGMRAVALSFRWSEGLADDLAADIGGNIDNPVWEMLWGSPGTMLAARFVGRFAPDPTRWAALGAQSARRLMEARGEDGVWTQDLYGRVRQLVGAGHGYAGNVQALLALQEWLEPRLVHEVVDGAAAFLALHAMREEGRANWSPEVVHTGDRPPLLQWCHGAPGVVTSMARAPAHQELDALLCLGGESIWQSGALTKGAGLCHGTAGNGWAFLVLAQRTQQDLWDERARVFAAEALAQVRAHRQEHGMARASLYTGDLGVALYFAALLDGDLRMPLLDV